MKGLYYQRTAFTLIEMLAVVVVLAILFTLINAGVATARRASKMGRDMNCARQLIGAYLAYAAAHDGELLPGYGDFPARDDRGEELHNPVNARYPWRLAPYFNYDMRLLWGAGSNDELARLQNGKREDYVYRLSVEPSYGLNTVFLGGDYQVLDPTSAKAAERYGNFCVTRLSQAVSPGRMVVFASAGGIFQSAEKLSGFFKVLAPNFNARNWTQSYSSKLNPASYGNVDFRYGDRAVTAMLDGHVEMLSFDQLNDMRRWSNQAALADDPRFTMGH